MLAYATVLVSVLCSIGGSFGQSANCDESEPEGCAELTSLCDVYPLVGALPGEMEVHLARGSSCQPICVDGYVSNGETVDCVTHPSSYGGVLEHNFECHLPCDISDIVAPTRGQLGAICSGTDGTIGFGEVCDLTCEEGFEVSNQPECQGRGDRTHMSSTTATCTAISPTATVAARTRRRRKCFRVWENNALGN